MITRRSIYRMSYKGNEVKVKEGKGVKYADILGKSFLGGSSRNCQGHKARVCVWSYTGAERVEK